ncbi:MAG TPA: LLM class F420-dependent oxidoreductase [Acidimicrobiales bacterium]
MKFGIAFANTGPFATPAGASVMAEAAEQSGFESVWTVEHVVVPRDYGSTYPYSPDGKMPGGGAFDIPDPLIWLTWIAAHTTTLRLATGILILPQRNPVVLAKEVATLDALSGGRMLLGIGIGWLEEEFDVLGVPFADRARRTDEYVEAMRALWSQDLPSFSGETVSFTDAFCRPRPVDGSVPVIVGGHSPAAARRAGRIGDGFFPAKGDLPALLGEMRKAAEQAGRDPDAIEVSCSGAAVVGGGDGALDEVGRLAELGVSRLLVPPLAYDPAALGDSLARFGDEVIARAP